MFCPKCGKESDGKWCSNCGAQLEIEESFGLNPYDQTQRLPRLAPDEEKDPDFTTASKQGDTAFNPPANVPSEKIYPSDGEDHDLDNFDPYGDYKEDENAKRKKMIIIISICAAAIFIISIVLAVVLTNKSNEKDRDINIPSSSENAELEELTALGEKYMAVGNYKEAEGVYKELMTLTDDEDAELIYKILYNYNLAVAELDDSNYKSAQKYFDKIPSEYPSYSIADDIEALSDDIAKYKLAADIFETVSELMNDGDYAEAEAAIMNIDESLLSSDDRGKLNKFKKTIEESREKEEEADLTDSDAEILLKEYKAGFVQAVNSGNADAASYVYKGSALHGTVKSLVSRYGSEGVSISADSTELSGLSRIDGTSWSVKSAETETHTDSDGKETTQSFKRTYVIKYIDGDYYFTDMR